MSEIRSSRRRPTPLLVLPILIGSLMFGAVMSGAVAGAADDVAKSASDADVAAGLAKIQSTADGIAKAVGSDGAQAENLLDDIEPTWTTIEGTVKENDQAAYLELEENFTLLRIGVRSSNAGKASDASESVAAAVKSYLAQHPAPAGRSAAEAAPSSGPRPAAAAAGAPASGLPRTGPVPGPMVLAGAALALGGLGVIGGARRSRSA